MPTEIIHLAFGIIIGFSLASLLLMERDLNTIDRELALMRDKLRVMAAFHAAAEVLHEHGLEDEAHDRIERELEEMEIRLEIEEMTEPSLLDRIRDLLPV